MAYTIYAKGEEVEVIYNRAFVSCIVAAYPKDPAVHGKMFIVGQVVRADKWPSKKLDVAIKKAKVPFTPPHFYQIAYMWQQFTLASELLHVDEPDIFARSNLHLGLVPKQLHANAPPHAVLEVSVSRDMFTDHRHEFQVDEAWANRSLQAEMRAKKHMEAQAEVHAAQLAILEQRKANDPYSKDRLRDREQARIKDEVFSEEEDLPAKRVVKKEGNKGKKKRAATAAGSKRKKAPVRRKKGPITAHINLTDLTTGKTFLYNV